jgi:hypothetical protein
MADAFPRPDLGRHLALARRGLLSESRDGVTADESLAEELVADEVATNGEARHRDKHKQGQDRQTVEQSASHPALETE